MEKNSRGDRCGQRPRTGLAQKDGARGKVCRPVLACESQRLSLRRKAAAAPAPVRWIHVELSNTSPNLAPRSPYLHQVKSSVLSLVRMSERMVWNGIGVVRVRERKSFCTFQEPPVFDSKRLPHISIVSILEGGLAYQA